MKNSIWFLPVAAVAASTIWWLKSSYSISELKFQVDNARQQIESVRTAKSGNGNSQLYISSAKGGGQSSNGRVDRRAFSELLFDEHSDEDSDYLEKMSASLQLQVGSMSEEELIAALDESAALGHSAEEQSALETLVVENLLEKNPQVILLRFEDRIGNDDDVVGSILSEALGKWADKDPTAAAHWMDKKINEGKFASKSLDGRSEIRARFEAALMARLLGNQSMEAMERIRALPENDGLVVLEQMDVTELGPSAQSAYADIVRNLVPEPDREGAFGYVASELVYEGGYEAVQVFMDQVKASPEERAEAAREAAVGKILGIVEERELKAGDIDEMRRWVQTQSPQLLDRLTGEVIGEAIDEVGGLGFEEAKNMVLRYHNKSSNDDVLAGFLSSYAGQSNPKKVRELMPLIRNPSVRQRLEEELE